MFLIKNNAGEKVILTFLYDYIQDSIHILKSQVLKPANIITLAVGGVYKDFIDVANFESDPEFKKIAAFLEDGLGKRFSYLKFSKVLK